MSLTNCVGFYCFYVWPWYLRSSFCVNAKSFQECSCLFQSTQENTSGSLMKDQLFQHETVVTSEPYSTSNVRPSALEDFNTRRACFPSQPSQVRPPMKAVLTLLDALLAWDAASDKRAFSFWVLVCSIILWTSWNDHYKFCSSNIQHYCHRIVEVKLCEGVVQQTTWIDLLLSLNSYFCIIDLAALSCYLNCVENVNWPLSQSRLHVY